MEPCLRGSRARSAAAEYAAAAICLVIERAVVKAASAAALAGCLLVSCWIGEAGAQSQTTDRAALVALYHATGGPNWTNKANWLSGEPIGEWYGVTTDAAGRVTRLTLVNNNLTGSLPVGLGTLSSLESLSLFRNQLSGLIPVELGYLSKLQFLQLQENNLTGPIPSELGGLQDLRLLSLRSNQLTGSIPSELGDLQELTGLYLGLNRLTGPIPTSLAYLSNLRGLHLHGNSLSGPIPREGNLPNLVRLVLSDNNLSGPVPPELGELWTLEWLDLAGNQLVGPVPSSFADLSNLTELYLGRNAVCLPRELQDWHDSIGQTDDLASCTAPAPVGTNRETLVALYNATGGVGWTNRANWLSGSPIGDWYGVTTDAAGRVTSLNLGNNNLTGSLPPGMGRLTALSLLFLHRNSGLTGPVPAEMANLARLSSFYSFGTGLCLPVGLGSWHDALTVKSPMSSCAGETPITMSPSFGTATVADRNWRQGEAIGAVALPAATGGVGALTYALTPALPAELRFAPSTRVLSGTPTAAFPRTVFTLRATDGEGNAATLTFGIAVTSGPVVGGTDRDALVALYNATGGTGWTNRANWLSGEPIGDWYGVTTDAAGRVTSLNLRSNNLTGSLPTEIGNLTALRFLYLYGNSGLTGPVPAEMANLTGLSSVYSFGTGLCLPPGLGSWHDGLTVKSPMSSCTGTPPPTAQGPSFGTATVADRNWRRGEAIGAVALPAATGGVGALTYRLTPTLPSGLRFAPSTRVLSGTPTVAFPRTVFTLRATDGEGNAATLTFGIAVTSGPVVGGTDRDALVALYNATGGTGWTNRANWLSGEPIGDWYGVTTDAAGRVTSLNLRSNNLTGSLPTEIGNLTALRFLYLYGNSGLTGPVPAEMANLTGLSSVYSFGTGLCLPPGLGSWHDALTVKSPMSSCTGAPPPTAQGPSFGTATVADRNWRRGEAIGAVALPAATGGVGALTYRLTPTLPSGLRFAPSTRVLSGTPTAAFPRTVFTLRATDGEGNAATLTFGIAVTSGPVVGGTDREALVALYNATGGTGWTNRANWLSGEPIGDWYGVTTDAAGRVTSLNLRSNNLTGSLPTEIGNLTALRFLYLYGNSGLTGPVPAEMANLTGLSSVYSFGTGLCLPPGLGSWHDGLTVKSPMSSCTGTPPPTAQGPSFGTATVADRNWRRGEAIGAVALPAATGGVGALTYRLTPTLPSGLRFAPSTRVLSGTPTVAFPRTVFTLRATDGEGNAATLTFGIAVTSGPVVGGTDRDALVALYNATGGTGWTNRANWLSGEPIGDWYGVTTDAAGRVTSLNLRSNNLTGSLPTEIGNLTALRFLYLYGNSGVTGPVPAEMANLTGLSSVYSFGTGLCLPPGLGSWHDALTVKSPMSSCTGAPPPTAQGPSFGTATVADRNWRRGEAIGAAALPAATGGVGALTYALTPALPSGLRFAPSTRVLSGTPTVAFPRTVFTLRATDGEGNAATLTFGIAVTSGPVVGGTDREALVALYNAAGGVGWTNRANWLSGAPIGDWYGVTTDAAGRVTSLNLGNNNLTGSLPPEMGSLTALSLLYLHRNSGLTGPVPAEMANLARLSRFYSFGTGLCLPLGLGGWHDALTVTSPTSSCAGETPITMSPSFGTATVAGRCYTENVTRPVLTLPPAAGGNGALTYRLTPALPAGLQFDPATRVLSGVLREQGWTTASSAFFYEAIDENGESAELTFTITRVAGSPDREALVAFYNATGGPNWNYNNWLSHCQPIGQWDGVTTDISDDRVTALELEGDGLSGPLPPVIAELTSLERLDLSDNALTGPLPQALGSLAALEDLDLARNEITGSLVSSVGNLKNLKTLDVSNNRLSGPLPASLGNLGMAEALDFSSNRLSGSLPPALGNLTGLGTLDLSHNPLSGTLPPAMGGMAGLRGLYLAGTRLSGDIPEAWKSLRLGTFRTSGSMLCLPEDMVSWYLAIRQHDYLDFKDVSGGFVEYSPKESCTEELSFNEQTIGDQSYEVRADLSGNPIASLTLPEATGGAGMLTYELAPALPVGLSFNGQTRVISGTPTQLHGAAVYSYTARDENDETAILTFTIAVTPATVQPPVTAPGSSATDRRALVAFYHATGGPNWKNNSGWLSNQPLWAWYGVNINPCPDDPFQCDADRIAAARVIGLGLVDNGLTGSIPPEIENLSELEALDLSENSLTGSIPPELGNLSKLLGLDLSANSLTGSIPPELGNLSELTWLRLARNRLTGSLPPELGRLSRLTSLFLIGNRFTGTVPLEWINLSSLTLLDIDPEICVPKALESWNGRLSFFIRICGDESVLPFATGPSRSAERTAITETLAASASALLSNVTDNAGAGMSESGGTSVVIGGQNIPFAERITAVEEPGLGEAAWLAWREDGSGVRIRGQEWDDLLRSSTFRVGIGADETGDGARLTVWGRASRSAFAGDAGQEAVKNGELSIGWMGMDARLGEYWRAGFATSRAEIDAGYDPGEGSGTGRLRMTLTGMYPWLRFSPDGKTEAWALTGFGRGEIRIAPANAPGYETGEVSSWVASVGARRSLVWTDGLDVALLGDAGMARVETVDGRGIADGLSADVWRARLGAEASWTASLANGVRATSFLDVATRLDGGQRTRHGFEASGGVRVSEPSLGLDIEARGRTLQLRSERERDVWGASLTARLSPGGGGKGLSLSISPRWGTSPQEAGALLRDDVFRLADKPLSASGERGSVDARADYGLSVGAGTLTPFSELGLRGGDDRRLRIGVRFAAGSGQRGSVTFEVRGDRHEYGGRDPDHRIGLTGNLRF